MVIGRSPERVTKLGITLSKEFEEGLIDLLRRNSDAFAWTAADMPGIDSEFICHHLTMNPNAHPVAQRKRRLSDEKRKVIGDETR